MKKTFFLIIILSSYEGFSQKTGLSYINSGALSKNISCGIGEIFIIPQLDSVIKEDKKNEEDFVAYPNPVNDILFIKTSLDIKNVSLYSIDGKFISDFNIHNDYKIDIEHLRTGVYILKSNESVFTPIKIIKE